MKSCQHSRALMISLYIVYLQAGCWTTSKMVQNEDNEGIPHLPSTLYTFLKN